MVTALISDKRELYVIGRPVTLDYIWTAKNSYAFLFQRTPKTVRIHPSQQYGLVRQLDKSANPNNIMGMNIEVDPTLEKDEFRVGSTSEIIKEELTL